MLSSRLHRAVFMILMVLWPLTTAFGPPRLVESDDARMPVSSTELRLLNSLRPPVLPAKSALVLDLLSGQVMFQRNAHARVAPASITKVMTAVLTIEQGDLSQQVVILQEDLVEGSTMGLQPGDQVTLEQLLWGLLLPSGNDAAQAIARTLGGGSVTRFVQQMNQKAQQLRLENTHFLNPHGLDDPNHYSSAYDLAQVSRYAMGLPLFTRMVSTTEYTVRANRTYTIHNTNQLLFLTQSVPGVNGVKTGFTDSAGDSLVASVDRGGRQVLVVVMGTLDRSGTAIALINFAYSYFAWVPVKAALPLPAVVRGALEPIGFVMVPLWQRPYFRIALEVARTSSGNPWGAPPGFLVAYMASQELGRLPLFNLVSS